MGECSLSSEVHTNSASADISEWFGEKKKIFVYLEIWGAFEIILKFKKYLNSKP